MAQKDVDNKIPIYKLKTTNEIMKYYDEWGIKNKYDQDMVDWNYTGPKESVNPKNFPGTWKRRLACSEGLWMERFQARRCLMLS